jgi:hypothetical protein
VVVEELAREEEKLWDSRTRHEGHCTMLRERLLLRLPLETREKEVELDRLPGETRGGDDEGQGNVEAGGS